MEMSDEAQEWTPWLHPVPKNSCSSLKQSVMAWLDRPVRDILASDEPTTSPCRALWWVFFIGKNPEILVIPVNTFYLYNTVCGGTGTSHLCHQNTPAHKHPQGSENRWSHRGSEEWKAVICPIILRRKIRHEKCSELKSAFQASILSTFLLFQIFILVSSPLPCLSFHKKSYFFFPQVSKMESNFATSKCTK